jgi:hypothetical protein
MLNFTLSAQWECPSRLGGNLRQADNSAFSYGFELTGGAGYLDKSLILNQMSLTGLDYTSGNHSFYFEGGVKMWRQNDYDLMIKSSNYMLGLRELFYNNQSSFGNLTFGLQSIRSEDVYLVNERVLGVNWKKSVNRFNVNIFGGMVSKQFARNGTFCNMAYLYDILPYINQPLIGEQPGQTNLAGATISFRPNAAAAEEFTDNDNATFLRVETLGLALYSEFGSWYKTPSFVAGLYSEIATGKGYRLKPELLFAASERPAVIACAKFEKSFDWNNSHRTVFDAHAFWQATFDGNKHDGKAENKGEADDKTVKATNVFSNILAGTVLRFDTPDMPFFTFSAKHTLPSWKAHLKMQYVSQIKANPNCELDVEAGKKFSDKLSVNLIYGYIKSPALMSNPHLFRMEIRFNF